MTNETQTTHIPGPWRLLGRFPGEWAVGPKGEVVVQAFGRDSTEADARLISAAPDLLAALEAALPELASDARHDDSMQDIHAQAAAALAKARGAS